MAVCTVNGQFYDNLCSFNVNATPVYGAKIKTNLLFATAITMPTISILGYDYATGSSINLTLTYYVFSGAFIRFSISSSGASNPPITLANENGKVSIFIDYKGYFMRFGVNAFAKGLAGETPANFSGWTVVDSPLIAQAENQVLVPYKNVFSGMVAIPDSGRLGIGTINNTAAPRAGLDIATTATDTLTSVFARQYIGNLSGRGSLLGVYNYPNVNNAPMFGLQSYYYGSLNAGVVFNKGASINGGFLTFLTNDGTEQMRINASGNVGIGTTNPGSYKLAVEGNVGARKVDVKMTSWADFVFHDAYKLPALPAIESYILTHQHLPGMPSEKEVLTNGLDLGECNKLLLQKVEELTLYLIDQDKQNKALAEQLHILQERVKYLAK
jgi:hypothetical protein